MHKEDFFKFCLLVRKSKLYIKTCLNSDIELHQSIRILGSTWYLLKKSPVKSYAWFIRILNNKFVTSLQTMYFFWLCVVMCIDLKMHLHPWTKMATHHTTHLYLLCIVWMFSCQLPLEKIVCKWLFWAYLSSHFNIFTHYCLQFKQL